MEFKRQGHTMGLLTKFVSSGTQILALLQLQVRQKAVALVGTYPYGTVIYYVFTKGTVLS